MLILVIRINSPEIFTAVTSVAIIMIYLAYLMVTVPMLRRRLAGRWPEGNSADAGFTMGRWGLPVNVLAIVWGTAMAINLAWPRADVYGVGYEWTAFAVIGVVAAVGLAWFVTIGQRSVGTLAEHAAEQRTSLK